MTENNSNNNNNLDKEDHLEILEHMTKAEMISELMIMLNEVKEEDMPTVHKLILQVTKNSSTNE